MANPRKRSTRVPVEQPRQPGDRAGQVAAGVVHLVSSTVVTALAGARDIGTEVGTAAVTAVRGSIRAAGEIGADVGRLARGVATGAIEAADRISAAAGRAADNLVDNTKSAVGGIVRRPAGPASTPEPAATAKGAGARTRGAGAPASRRKPLAPGASRLQSRASTPRRKRNSAG